MSLVSSVRWAAVAQVSRIAAQLISVTVLSRILPQQAYGMLAMAMTITNLAVVFRDFGTSTVIIQRRDLPDGLKAAVHSVNVLIGFLTMAIMLALALPTARVYGVAELAPMIAVLSLIFPIAGYGLLAQALVERESGFRLLARIEALSILAGLATSISLAMLGADVWSLVAQMLVSTLVTNLQLQLAVKERSGFAWSLQDITSVLKFGGDVSLFRLLIYAEQNADGMIIGRALGPLALATYSMSSKIALFPLQNITWPISRALFPAFSRNQNSPAAMAATYLRSVSVICIVAAPIMAGVFLLRHDLTLLLFGPRWDAIPGVLQWLAPVGFLQALTATTGVVFLALGRTRLMLKLGLLGCALQVGGYAVGVRWGIQGVAAGFFVANLLNVAPCLAFVMRCLGITPGRACDTVARPLAACLAMCLVLAWLGQLTQLAALPLVIAVALKTACAAGTYLFVLGAVLRQDLSGIVALVRPS
jgi:PST family polysaccharide transporter